MHTYTNYVQVRMKLKNSKEAILNQALTIFSRLGFNKTTMADIANASNRGRRTIYTYFNSKEEVFDAVVERELDKVLDLIHEKLNETENASEKLAIYVETRLNAIIQLTKYHEALHVAYLQNYTRVEHMRRKLDKEESNILNGIIELGISQNKFDLENIEMVIKNLSVLIRGIEFILIKENKEDFTKLQIKSLQQIILNGLIKQNK